MKPIKNRTFIRAPMFVWALLAILLVSSMIGTIVWAKSGKPNNPGKPSPKPKTFNYQIWIGSGDLVLQPYGEPEIDYLLVEDVGYSGRWLPPPENGKYTGESWSVELVSLNPDGEPGDYCGTYIIDNAEVAGILGIDSGDEAYGFYMYHIIQKHPSVGEKDYWLVGIAWQVGTLSNDPDIPHQRVLVGYTDMDIEPEGEYEKNTDTWTVTFVKAGVSENTESGEIVVLWSGELNFTVKITRTPSEP